MGTGFFLPIPTHGMEVLPWMQHHWVYWDLTTLSWWCTQREASREDLRLLHPQVFSSYNRMSLRKKCSIVPTLSSRAKAQRIALEVKQAIKQRTLNLLPKELISFVAEYGEDQTLGCSQKQWKWEVVMKGNWEEIGRLIGDPDKTIGWPVFWREAEKVAPGRSLPGDRTNFKRWPKQLTFLKSLDWIVPVYGTVHALRELLKTIEQSTGN